jgi:hypothetical protein
VEECSCGLICGTFLAYPWRECGKPVMTANVLTKIWTRHLSNTNQKYYRLRQLAHYSEESRSLQDMKFIHLESIVLNSNFQETESQNTFPTIKKPGKHIQPQTVFGTQWATTYRIQQETIFYTLCYIWWNKQPFLNIVVFWVMTSCSLVGLLWRQQHYIPPKC